MSLALTLSDWDKASRRRINADLRFYEKQVYLPGQRFQPRPKHIDFWRTRGDVTYVPLNYGMFVQDQPDCVDLRDGIEEDALLDADPVRRPQQKPEIDIAFTGKLLESKDQLSVASEATERLRRANSILLHLPTGKGKTTMTVYLSAEVTKRLSLVLVEKKHVKAWAGTIDSRTTGSAWVFKVEMASSWVYKAASLKDGEWVLDEATRKKRGVGRIWNVGERENGQSKFVVEPDSYTHIVVTPGMFYAKDPQNKKKLIQQIPQLILDMVGLLVIDEVHNYYTDKNINILCALQPEYFIACSATPRKGKKGFHPMLYAMVGEENTIYRSLDEEFVVVKYNTRVPLLVGADPKANGYWNELQAAQCENVNRNRIAVDIIKAHPDRKVMVVTWRNKQHVPVIKRLLDEENISNSYYVGTQASYKDSRVLVTTISKGGEGFDQESACEDFSGERIDLIILTVTMDSVDLFQQVIGRAVGRTQNPWIIVLSDINNTCTKHIKKMYSFVHKQPRAIFFEMNHGDDWPELEEEYKVNVAELAPQH